MNMEVTNVVNTLFSVRKFKQAGNMVVFGADEGDFIINKATKKKIPIKDNGKNFTMDIFIKKDNKKTEDRDSKKNINVVGDNNNQYVNNQYGKSQYVTHSSNRGRKIGELYMGTENWLPHA